MKKHTLFILIFLISILSLNQSLSQNSQIISASCGSCGKNVSKYAKVGDVCPHCNVRWGYENNVKGIKPSQGYNYEPQKYYSEQFSNNNITINGNSNFFKVVNKKAYFYSFPNISTKRKAYLLQHQISEIKSEENGFIYTEFINTEGIKTIGWIQKSDIIIY